MQAETTEHSRIVTLPFKKIFKVEDWQDIIIKDEDAVTFTEDYPVNIELEDCEIGCDGNFRYLAFPEPSENFVEYTIRLG